MAVKTYQLMCEKCSWKRITDGSDVGDLYELKLAPIPRGIPKINKLSKKVTTQDPKDRIRKFRCPECGHTIKPRRIKNPQAVIDEKLRKEETEKQREIDREEARRLIATQQAEDFQHDQKAEEEKRKQRKLEAEMRLSQYDKDEEEEEEDDDNNNNETEEVQED